MKREGILYGFFYEDKLIKELEKQGYIFNEEKRVFRFEGSKCNLAKIIDSCQSLIIYESPWERKERGKFSEERKRLIKIVEELDV